jgi:hypothetical protein
MDNTSKAQLAAQLIIKHCPRAGSCWMDSAAMAFIDELSTSIATSPSSELFGMRHKEHVAYAIHAVATSVPLDPLAALASAFLSTRFELYFRLISKHLNANGTWKSPEAQQAAKTVLADKRLDRGRINDVSLAYRIMLLHSDHPVSRLLIDLESKLTYSFDKTNEFYHHDIGTRIKVLRDPGSHGFYSDLSSEGYFYALLTGIIFYSSTYH